MVAVTSRLLAWLIIPYEDWRVTSCELSMLSDKFAQDIRVKVFFSGFFIQVAVFGGLVIRQQGFLSETLQSDLSPVTNKTISSKILGYREAT